MRCDKCRKTRRCMPRFIASLRRFLIVLAWVTVSGLSLTAPRLGPIWSDEMALQHGLPFNVSGFAHPQLHLTPHTPHLTPHTNYTSHLTPHTPHTSHTSHTITHLTPHTSHLTPHTSQPTPHIWSFFELKWTCSNAIYLLFHNMFYTRLSLVPTSLRHRRSRRRDAVRHED